jgi:hypothetical protein
VFRRQLRYLDESIYVRAASLSYHTYQHEALFSQGTFDIDVESDLNLQGYVEVLRQISAELSYAYLGVLLQDMSSVPMDKCVWIFSQ